MFEIVSEIVKNGHTEELRKIIKQYEDVSKRKENKKNERF